MDTLVNYGKPTLAMEILPFEDVFPTWNGIKHVVFVYLGPYLLLRKKSFVTHMGVSENGGTPKSSINRDFPYKPSILRYPYFWKHPNQFPKNYHWFPTCSLLCPKKTHHFRRQRPTDAGSTPRPWFFVQRHITPAERKPQQPSFTCK